MPAGVNKTTQTVNSDTKDGIFVDKILSLQELDTDLYMTPKSWKSWSTRGTYGGRIVSQALFAASKTVPDGLNLHSMHSYFLRAGNSNLPTIYRVLRTRDGHSFSARTVSAIQKGKPILTLQASFHNEDAESPSILQYQPAMPIVKHHSELLTMNEYAAGLTSKENRNASLKFLADSEIDFPVEIKPVHPEVYVRLVANPNRTLLSWVRVSGNVGDDQNIHRCAAAFAADWSLLLSALTSNCEVRVTMTASLDYSLWFHKSIKMNEWVLYESVATQMHTGRPLCHGRLWTEDGQLVTSVAQEGILRGKL